MYRPTRLRSRTSGGGVHTISPRLTGVDSIPVAVGFPGDNARRGATSSRSVVRGLDRRHHRGARGHPHGHRDRQHHLHHHDDEPRAGAPRLRVRRGHRVRRADRELDVHRRVAHRDLRPRPHPRHHRRQPRLRGGRVPDSRVLRRHHPRRDRDRRRAESKSRPEQGIVTFEHRAFNQRDELVCRARRNALMHRRPT